MVSYVNQLGVAQKLLADKTFEKPLLYVQQCLVYREDFQ